MHDDPAMLWLTGTDRGDGVTCLAVAGEVDMSTGDDFRRTVARHLRAPGVHTLLLDLAGLTFIDSNGVAVLVEAYRTAGERGLSFAATNATARIRSVLELMGVYELLTAARAG